MKRFLLILTIAIAVFAVAALTGLAQESGPYKVVKTAKVGGDGGFDYVYADVNGRRLYIPRRGQGRGGDGARVDVYNLDSLEKVGEIPMTSAAGAAVSPKDEHGFATSRPVAMWDAKTLKPIKTIDVKGGPDGILYDAFNDRVYIWSHSAPNATVIDAKDGSVLGTIDLGGAPEQAATDGKGRIYVDVEDKGNIAVVDAKNMSVITHYDLQGKGGQCAGLALDVKNEILFAACRNPQMMVMLSAKDGKILDTLPIGRGTDGAGFNANTKEAFASAGDGTLTIVKENSPTSFAVEQTVLTMNGAKTMTLDTKTNRVLLIAAEYEAPPAPPAGTPAPQGPGRGRGGFGRGAMVAGSFSIVVVGK